MPYLSKEAWDEYQMWQDAHIYLLVKTDTGEVMQCFSTTELGERFGQLLAAGIEAHDIHDLIEAGRLVVRPD